MEQSYFNYELDFKAKGVVLTCLLRRDFSKDFFNRLEPKLEEELQGLTEKHGSTVRFWLNK